MSDRGLARLPRAWRAWALGRGRLGPPERLVVVDPGAWSLTAIEVERRGDRVAITAALRRERRAEAPWDEDGVAAALRAWIGDARVRARRAILVAAPRHSVAARVDLPPMAPGERAAGLRWEMARLGAGSPEAILADRLTDGPEGPGRPCLGVGVEAAHADGLARIAAGAGLRLAGIAVTAGALRAFGARLAGDRPRGEDPPAVGEQPSERAVALAEVGATRTQVACFRGARLDYVREVALGGQAVTESLTGAVATGGGPSRLTLAEAEAVKRQLRLEPVEGDSGGEGPAFPLMRPVLERLAGEIAMSLRYYRDQLGGPPIGAVWLAGGGACLAGLDRWLATQLGLPVRRLDPLAGLEVRASARQVLDAHPAAAFGVVVGAALVGIPGPGLLPATVRRAGLARRAMAAAWVGLALVAAAGAGTGAWQRAEARRAGAALRSLGPAVAAAERTLRTAAEARQRAEALRPPAALARGILDGEPYWEGLLKDLAQAVPREVRLREFTIAADRGARLLGTARDASRPAAEAIVALVERLQASPFFTRARLAAGHEADAGAHLEFEIVGRVE